MLNKGKLFLIPTLIADDTQANVIPVGVVDQLQNIRFFLAENQRTARRYLSSLKIYESIETLSVEVLDKDTPADQLENLFEPLRQGHDLGIVSESGCPGIADPGALAVRYAHDHAIQVVPWVGPSSILLALMASGLNGQRFAFHGYLPIDNKEAAGAIKRMEKMSRDESQTQIFIETPYRNKVLADRLVRNLHPQTRLCIAVDLTGKSESIKTMTVKDWRTQSLDWPKLPAIFLFLATA